MRPGKIISLVQVAITSLLCFAIHAEGSPTILNSSSGFFSYPVHSIRYPPATEVTWLIKVDEGKHINLTLDVRDVEAYRGKCIDIIEIKDGNNSRSPLLGGYCNLNKPTYSILSSSNALRVWFQSAKNSDGGLGFRISYNTVTDQVCGSLDWLKSFPGTISTPRYPDPYPNNRKCTWKIRAPRGMYIHIEFHEVYNLEVLCSYHIEMECICTDTLVIKDGGKSLPYALNDGNCFAKPRPFTSRTNEVSLKFVSDYSGRFEGFSATYTTSLTKDCGADIWNDHGLITSPNYPYDYHSYKTCIWRITVPDDHYIIITFHEFDINNASRFACLRDSLAIHDGYTEYNPLLAKMCNGHYVNKVNSTGNQVYIVFQSGMNLKAKGFKANFASHEKDMISGDVKKREPRHEEIKNSGVLKEKPINTATKMYNSWMMIALLLGTLGHSI
ncbi:tolloid-like protein 1 [Dendronephthya gigantea]|uniref:tolloid-like protein 1 n=1 Tax=Dendronephthya gigantea TaxID=151771 RepID=UPI00106AF89A|nr:tolloid-like protein 1 [Dendronephthya gigantea]